jgi:hypothetical protein
MATRFLEDLHEASIQTREEIQEESKAKVGETEMDEGCEDCTIGVDCLCVILASEVRAYADGCCSHNGLRSVVFGLE